MPDTGETMGLREAISDAATFLYMQLENSADFDWPEESVRRQLVAVAEEHSGDCTNQPWTCVRCAAEEAVEWGRRFTERLVLALPQLAAQQTRIVELEAVLQALLAENDTTVAKIQRARTAGSMALIATAGGAAFGDVLERARAALRKDPQQ